MIQILQPLKIRDCHTTSINVQILEQEVYEHLFENIITLIRRNNLDNLQILCHISSDSYFMLFIYIQSNLFILTLYITYSLQQQFEWNNSLAQDEADAEVILTNIYNVCLLE